MAADSVNPLWRAWQSSGLLYVLCPEKAPAGLSLCLEAPTASQTAKKNPISPPRPTPATTVKMREKPHSPGRMEKPDTPPPAGAKKVAPPPAKPEEPAPPLQNWPEIWQKRFDSSPRTPVVWSYTALKEDLGGEPSAARRNFFKRLLKDLGHPAGTHSFWPFALPDGQGGESIRPDIFWEALRLLKARVLVLVDSEALGALGLPEDLRPLHSIRTRGLQIILAGDINSLANAVSSPETAGRYTAMSTFLRNMLRPYAAQQQHKLL